MNTSTRNNSCYCGWRRFSALAGILAIFSVIGFGFSGCGGGDTASVAAPSVPTDFTVAHTTGTTLSETLSWSVPLSGGEATSFEIYRSTLPGTVYQSTNHMLSVPVVSGQTSYTFVDDVGLTPGVETYWVVSARNAGGETPTTEVGSVPIGSGDAAFGNNFSGAIIFADGVGITGLTLDTTKSWTSDIATLDYNTGMRPLSTETLPTVVLPYLDPASAFVLDGVNYYRQASASTWQGEWTNGAGTTQNVNAAWGDNLVSQNLTSESTIRIETVLTETLTVPMTSYTMRSLYGSQRSEVFGTDGTTYDNYTANVFAADAHLTIQKLDANGNPDGSPVTDQTLWQGDGPGYFGAEINGSGNLTYGFVWNLKNQVLPGDVTTGKSGTWRLTFSLDTTSPVGTSRNTSIQSVSNGVLDNQYQAHIDITVQ